VRLIPVEGYLEMQRAAIEWRVHGLVPKPGKIAFLGPPKAGKTFFAIDLANHAAWGRDFLGHKTEASRVLYLQLDTGEVAWRDMLRKLVESGMRFSPDLLFVHPDDQKRPLNIMLPETRAYLKEALAEGSPDLVFIDTLRKLHNGDENDSTEMKAVMDHIEDIFGGVALVLIHHTRKIPADVADPDPSTYSRGSNFISGDMDGLWLLYHNKLKVDSRFDENLLYRLVREENGTWSCPDQDDRAALVQSLLAHCAEHPTTTHNVLSKMAKAKFGVSRSAYYRLLAGRACAHRRPATDG
jgi:RecA-family ATPase